VLSPNKAPKQIPARYTHISPPFGVGGKNSVDEVVGFAQEGEPCDQAKVDANSCVASYNDEANEDCDGAQYVSIQRGNSVEENDLTAGTSIAKEHPKMHACLACSLCSNCRGFRIPPHECDIYLPRNVCLCDDSDQHNGDSKVSFYSEDQSKNGRNAETTVRVKLSHFHKTKEEAISRIF